MKTPPPREWWSTSVGAWCLTDDDRDALGQGALDLDLAAELDVDAQVAASHPAPPVSWARGVDFVVDARQRDPDAFTPHLFGDLQTSSARDLVDLARWRSQLAADTAWAPDEVNPSAGAALDSRAADVLERAAIVERSGVRVVAQGVDTLAVSMWLDLRDDVRQRLDVLREGAEHRGIVVACGDLRWTLAAHGRRGGFRYLLEGPACAIALRAHALDGQAGAFVEFRSAYLWRLGAARAVDAVARMLRTWAPRETPPPRVTVARIDLAVDVQGWAPTGREFTADVGAAPVFVSRAVARAQHAESVALAKQLGADSLHWRGRRFSGYTFGSGGALLCRIYDKKLEAGKSGKRWLGAVWSLGGGDPRAPVWRVEYQVRGEAVREAVLAVTDARAHAVAARAADWPHVRRCLDGLWAYLTTRDGRRGWLDLRDPPTLADGRPDAANIERARASKQFDRWPRSPAWVAIASSRWGASSTFARLRAVRAATQEQAAAVDAPLAAPVSPLVPLDALGAPDALRIAHEAGRPSTVSTMAAARDRSTADARMLAVSLEVDTAADRADQLRAQLVGTLLSYAANVAAARGIDPPRNDRDARELLLAVLDLAIAEGSADGTTPPTPSTDGQLAARLRARTARAPTAAAIRRDLRAAAGMWRRV